MNLLERIAHYQKVWSLLLPHLAPPSAEDAGRWGLYPVPAVEAGILRTAKRFTASRIPPSFDQSEALRYTTSVARRITETVLQK